MRKLRSLFLIAICAFAISACGSWNVDYVKERSEDTWKSLGFQVVGYDGFLWSTGIGPYGGGDVWYVLKRIPDNGILYGGYLERWGDEVHMYSLRAYDAIKPK